MWHHWNSTILCRKLFFFQAFYFLLFITLKFFCINAWTDTLHFVWHHYLESSRMYSPLVFNVYFYFFRPRVPRFFISSLFQGCLMILSENSMLATGFLIFLPKQCFVLKFFFWFSPFPYVFMYPRLQVGDWQMQWLQERSLLWTEDPRSIRCFLYVYRYPMKVWTVNQVKQQHKEKCRSVLESGEQERSGIY